MALVTPRVAVIAVAAVVAAGLGFGVYVALSPGDALAACRAGGGTVGADIGGPFALSDPDGATVTAESLIDRPTLVYFGYTHCPDFCPMDAANMATAHDILAQRGVDANIVFITIDPERDDAAALGAFRDAIHPDLIALTGDADAVAQAAKAYRVYYAKAGDDPEFYLMDHSTFTYLMHPEKGFLDFFRHGEQPEAIAERVSCYADVLG